MRPDEILKEGQKAFFAKPPDFQTATECFQRVISAAPGWAEGYHWLASAWERLGEPDQAAGAYRQAIECDPRDARPRIALGRLLTSIGRPKEAIRELQTGVELKPHYAEADARLFLAEAYEQANELPKAKEQWNLVERMEPCYPSYDEPAREARRKLEKYGRK